MDQFADIQERLLSGLFALTDRLPAILADPRAYPREAMLIAAIAALVLVLVVLSVLVIIDVVRSRERRRNLGVRRRYRWFPLAVGSAAVVLALLLATLAPNIPAVSGVCGTCHQVAPAVDAWRDGAHSDVSCYGCHSLGGVSGSLHAAARGAGRLLGVFSSAAVYGSRCESCHEELEQGVVGTVIRMRHSDVIDAGFGCVDCHPDAGHSARELSANRIEYSLMGVCLACHDGVIASSDCVLCHDCPPSDRSDGQIVANTPAPVTCSGCHAADTERNCIACHGLELPHPTPFFGEHAGRAWNDPPLCMTCHDEARSEPGCGCHGDVNLHGTYTQWFPRHGPQALIAWPGGCNCHDASFCALCHIDSPF